MYYRIFGKPSFRLVSFSPLTKKDVFAYFKWREKSLTFVLQRKKFFLRVPLIMTETFPSEEHLRNCMLFQFHAKKNATEATKIICDLYEDVLDIGKCQRWFKKFKSGNIDLKN